jgi:hypothetical protein
LAQQISFFNNFKSLFLIKTGYGPGETPMAAVSADLCQNFFSGRKSFSEPDFTGLGGRRAKKAGAKTPASGEV